MTHSFSVGWNKPVQQSLLTYQDYSVIMKIHPAPSILEHIKRLCLEFWFYMRAKTAPRFPSYAATAFRGQNTTLPSPDRAGGKPSFTLTSCTGPGKPKTRVSLMQTCPWVSTPQAHGFNPKCHFQEAFFKHPQPSWPNSALLMKPAKITAWLHEAAILVYHPKNTTYYQELALAASKRRRFLWGSLNIYWTR